MNLSFLSPLFRSYPRRRGTVHRPVNCIVCWRSLVKWFKTSNNPLPSLWPEVPSRLAIVSRHVTLERVSCIILQTKASRRKNLSRNIQLFFPLSTVASDLSSSFFFKLSTQTATPKFTPQSFANVFNFVVSFLFKLCTTNHAFVVTALLMSRNHNNNSNPRPFK